MTKTNTNELPITNSIGKQKHIGFERQSITYWIDEEVHRHFMTACRVMNRRSCDVIEGFEKSFIKCVSGIIVAEDPCTVKPVIFNIGRIEVVQKYATRGPQALARAREEEAGVKYVDCPKAGKRIPIEGPQSFTCRWECKFNKGCDVYDRAKA